MRVLHISLDTAMGGIESFLLNVYQKIDRDKVQFDFIEYGEKKRDFDTKFLSLGAHLYKLSDRKKHPFESRKQLENILKKNKYCIVHIHKNSLSEVGAIEVCKKMGINTIIVHSHNSSRDSKLITMLHRFNRSRLNLDNIYKFSCSKLAAEWMFKSCENVKIIKNGIDTARFNYDFGKRQITREKLALESNCLVIGSVGRLTEQKNPLFILDVIKNLNKENVKLLWVGDGSLRQDVENKIKELGIEDKVILTGAVTNPEDYYLAMDVFVMPSLYEGFPIAAIEAQCSGLPAILSTNITNEAELTNNVAWLGLDDPVKWSKKILETSKLVVGRHSNSDYLYENGYDMQSTVDYLQNFYLSRGFV